MKHVALRVLCEGPTEQNFVVQVLGPHLRQYLVFARPEPLVRGGGGSVTFERLRKAIKADLGRSRSHEYLTTMIDLYGLSKYPGAEKKANEFVLERVSRIESEMATGLPHPRFLPYVQLHEFEALVLVDPDQIPSQFPDGEADLAPDRLRLSLGTLKPEEVNDGETTAPSKRILREIPAYTKAIAGPAITARIGLPRLREACPHFAEWVGRLENLSQE